MSDPCLAGTPPVHGHVLIVEDHPLYRDALTRVLAAPGGVARCSAAATAAEAQALLARQADIDVVISDFRLQQGNGLELLQAIGQRWPTVARVLMSGADDPSLPERARRLGLMGFLPKTLEPRRMAQAIAQVLGGDPWYPDADDEAAADGGLTPRQASVLACVATGQSNKHIARTLGLSARTIKYHLEGTFARLGVGNRAEAVACALERGLISLPR